MNIDQVIGIKVWYVKYWIQKQTYSIYLWNYKVEGMVYNVRDNVSEF